MKSSQTVSISRRFRTRLILGAAISPRSLDVSTRNADGHRRPEVPNGADLAALVSWAKCNHTGFRRTPAAAPSARLRPCDVLWLGSRRPAAGQPARHDHGPSAREDQQSRAEHPGAEARDP